MNWLIGSKEETKKLNASYQKKVPTMTEVLIPPNATPEQVCKNYQLFSFLFVMCFLLPQLNNMTARFIARIFNLPCGSDGEAMLEELRKMRGRTYDRCC